MEESRKFKLTFQKFCVQALMLIKLKLAVEAAEFKWCEGDKSGWYF